MTCRNSMHLGGTSVEYEQHTFFAVPVNPLRWKLLPVKLLRSAVDLQTMRTYALLRSFFVHSFPPFLCHRRSYSWRGLLRLHVRRDLSPLKRKSGPVAATKWSEPRRTWRMRSALSSARVFRRGEITSVATTSQPAVRESGSRASLPQLRGVFPGRTASKRGVLLALLMQRTRGREYPRQI